MHNIEIRSKMKSEGVFGYEIAAKLGIAETLFSRKLARKEMTTEEKERIYKIIEKIKKGDN